MTRPSIEFAKYALSNAAPLTVELPPLDAYLLTELVQLALFHLHPHRQNRFVAEAARLFCGSIQQQIGQASPLLAVSIAEGWINPRQPQQSGDLIYCEAETEPDGTFGGLSMEHQRELAAIVSIFRLAVDYLAAHSDSTAAEWIAALGDTASEQLRLRTDDQVRAAISRLDQFSLMPSPVAAEDQPCAR